MRFSPASLRRTISASVAPAGSYAACCRPTRPMSRRRLRPIRRRSYPNRWRRRPDPSRHHHQAWNWPRRRVASGSDTANASGIHVEAEAVLTVGLLQHCGFETSTVQARSRGEYGTSDDLRPSDLSCPASRHGLSQLLGTYQQLQADPFAVASLDTGTFVALGGALVVLGVILVPQPVLARECARAHEGSWAKRRCASRTIRSGRSRSS